MIKEEHAYLCAAVRHVINGEKLPREFFYLSAETKSKLIIYAEKQNLLPFLQADYIFTGTDLGTDMKKRYFEGVIKYAYYDSRQAEAFSELTEAFEKAGIYCIPLKGIRTKQYYPSSEMRAMGDIDILYKRSQAKLVEEMMKSLGYKCDSADDKHDHYERDGITVEMHKRLFTADNKLGKYFEDVWEKSSPKPGKHFIFEMNFEQHYLFTLCHLLVHFIRGGAGLRMVLDIYILSHVHGFDRTYVDSLLREMKLERFEKSICLLADKWFLSGYKEECAADVSDLETYISGGRVFGSESTGSLNTIIRYNTRWDYIAEVLFPSYRTLQSYYPWLKTPLLLPAAWLLRTTVFLYKRHFNQKRKFYKDKIWKEDNREIKEERSRFFEKYGIYQFI